MDQIIEVIGQKEMVVFVYGGKDMVDEVQVQKIFVFMMGYSFFCFCVELEGFLSLSLDVLLDCGRFYGLKRFLNENKIRVFWIVVENVFCGVNFVQIWE